MVCAHGWMREEPLDEGSDTGPRYSGADEQRGTCRSLSAPTGCIAACATMYRVVE